MRTLIYKCPTCEVGELALISFEINAINKADDQFTTASITGIVECNNCKEKYKIQGKKIIIE